MGLADYLSSLQAAQNRVKANLAQIDPRQQISQNILDQFNNPDLWQQDEYENWVNPSEAQYYEKTYSDVPGAAADEDGNVPKQLSGYTRYVGNTGYSYDVNGNLIGIGSKSGGIGDFVKMLAPAVLSAVAPGLGTTIGSALGAGATFAPIVGGAVLGGGVAGLTGGDIGKGALMGGLGGASGTQIGDTGVSVGQVTGTVNAIDAANRGDLLGAVTGAANVSGMGNTQVGDTGLTINDLAKDAKLAAAVISGKPDAVFNAITTAAKGVANSSADAANAINPYFKTGAGTGALPTEAPTPAPTEAPTPPPTEASTHAPTEAPTPAPTEAPTIVGALPTEAPTPAPTEAPTPAPTEAPTTVGALPTEAPVSTTVGALPVTTAVDDTPSGVNLASANTETVSDAGNGPLSVEVSGVPIFSDSRNANTVSPPVGYDLMPSALNEKDSRPAGAYYDITQNAWFMPNNAASNLNDALAINSDINDAIDPYFDTSANTGALPVVNEDTANNDSVSTGALPTTTPVDNIPEMVITAPRPTTTPVDDSVSTGALPTTTPVDNIPEMVITAPRPTTTPVDDSVSTGALPTTTPVDNIPEMVITAPRPTTTPVDDIPEMVITAPRPTTTSTEAPVTSPGGGGGGGGGGGTSTTTTTTPTKPTTPFSLPSANTTSGALPGDLQGTSLAPGALGQQGKFMQDLKQLYPQLANVDPHLLGILSGKANESATQQQQPQQQQQQNTQQPSATSKLLSPIGESNALMSSGLKLLSGAGSLGAFARGGQVASANKGPLSQHVPEFITGKTGNYVQGAGDGQSDDIPAMLADGEYVFDADIVAALGNGSNKAGARVLDKMREEIRKHKRAAHPGKIPPPAKSPLEYLKG
jgi:hypothetical protein